MLKPDEFPSNLDIKPFEIKESRGNYLVIILLSILIFSSFLHEMFIENKWTDIGNILIITFSLISIIIFTTIILKPTILLKINTTGIWTEKGGWISWNRIDYFYTTLTFNGYGPNVWFFLKEANTKKEIMVDISNTEYANEKTIRRYIEINRGDNVVTDLGKM